MLLFFNDIVVLTMVYFIYLCVIFVVAMAFLIIFVANRCINCEINVLFILYDICE